MIFEIDNFDLVPYIKHKGLKWSSNDIDDEAERVVEDAQMQRNRVATKLKAEVQLKIIDATTLAAICSKLQPEYINLKFTDFTTNTVVTKEFYGTTINAAVAIITDDIDKYDNCSFNLIER